MKQFESDIIDILRESGALPEEKIAERLGRSEKDVSAALSELKKRGIIRGERVVFDESKIDGREVKAIIEVKVRPEREGGFDRIAQRLSRFPEVSSLYLVSGGYDLELEVAGKTLQDVAGFVSSKLATIEGVISTSTHFILKKYKESGMLLEEFDDYEKLKISP